MPTSATIGELSYIKRLYLNKLDSLAYMSEIDYNEELSNSSFIPSLEVLKLSCCPNLKGWWRQRRDSSEEVDDDNNHLLPFFPGLSILEIKNCPKLTSVPLFPNVKGLTLDMCSLKPLKQTSTLQIEIANSSVASLSKLEYLKIVNSMEVDLSNFGDAIEYQGLKSLQSLEIKWCSKLESLPEGMSGLTSLHRLHIWCCPKLKSLPEGIQDLTSLNTLQIIHCPILLERCKRETGKDWPKIAHILNLEGDLYQQQTN